MKFPFFSLKGSSTPDSFFGLFLKEHKGIGYIFSGVEGKLTLLAKHEFSYSNGWDNLSQDVDEVLFKLENETKRRIEKTIFFVFSHLVDEISKEIKKPYLSKIKELTKSLEIKPIGYIECYDAVVDFIQKRENAPLTSILVELDDSNVDVFIYKGGHKISSHVVVRTDNIIQDLHSVFDTMGRNTLLPNRVILYNSSNLVAESTKIISHRWSPDLFVQLPRVEILKEEDIVSGLTSVFEQQIYASAPPPATMPEAEEPKDVLGFVVGKDIRDMETAPPDGEPVSPVPVPAASRNPLAGITDAVKSVRLPAFRLSAGSALRYASVAGGIAILIGVMFLFEFFLHKAQVRAVFSSTPIDKKVTKDAVVGGDVSGAITIRVATSSVIMKDVKVTTGKRDVGEKAQGEVTVYNFDDKEKTFSKGTVISVDNLEYALNDDVKVSASTLASDASAKLPGKAKVKVTANEIGTDSNIDKNKRFKIADLSTSEFFAMNDSGFSGGTKKTIKTVSKKDTEDLQASLLEKAKEQKKNEIYKTKDERVTLIDSLMEFDLDDVKFSKELGEEGDSLALSANVVAKYYYFENSQINAMLKSEVEAEIPSGYELQDKNFGYKVEGVKKDKDGDITMTVRLKAKATKKVDAEKMRAILRMKKTDEVADLLRSEFGAVSSIVEVNPNVPLLGGMLPLFGDNILLRIDSK